MEFDIDNYPGKVVMHCPEEWMAEVFCDYLHSIGKKWSSGISYNRRRNYREHKEETCYWFSNGQYGSLSFYKNNGYKILEFEDFSENFPFGDKDNPITISKVATQTINAFFDEFAVVGGVTNA